MKKKKEKPQDKVPKDICFTIMPFGGWFDNYYEEIYRPAIANTGLVAKRADDLYRPSNIVNDIWDYTKKAKIILADLTGKNPNVFYELGLAHAITKPAILITQSMDDIPFDLRSLRIIQYDKNLHNWGEVLQEKIELAIKETLESPDDSIPPTFMDVRGVKKAQVSPEEKEMLQIKTELELLKREVRTAIPRNPRIPSTEASHRVRRMVEKNYTSDQILNEMTRYGVPRSWLEKRIKELTETQTEMPNSFSDREENDPNEIDDVSK